MVLERDVTHLLLTPAKRRTSRRGGPPDRHRSLMVWACPGQASATPEGWEMAYRLEQGQGGTLGERCDECECDGATWDEG
jgi:hypothetical protein